MNLDSMMRKSGKRAQKVEYKDKLWGDSKKIVIPQGRFIKCASTKKSSWLHLKVRFSAVNNWFDLIETSQPIKHGLRLFYFFWFAYECLNNSKIEFEVFSTPLKVIWLNWAHPTDHIRDFLGGRAIWWWILRFHGCQISKRLVNRALEPNDLFASRIQRSIRINFNSIADRSSPLTQFTTTTTQFFELFQILSLLTSHSPLPNPRLSHFETKEKNR